MNDTLDQKLCQQALNRALNAAKDDTGRLRLDPETVEQDLARLVLGIMSFLRDLMELQALRRMDSETLTAAEEERLGLTLMRARAALVDMAGKFGLSEEDLSLDLGPLGRLS